MNGMSNNNNNNVVPLDSQQEDIGCHEMSLTPS